MNHRERVLAALDHREPDRVPIDFGGTVDSTISALSYQTLRRALDLPPTVTRVCEPPCAMTRSPRPWRAVTTTPMCSASEPE